MFNFPINITSLIMAYADESMEKAQKKSLKECLKTIKKLPDGWYNKFASFYHRFYIEQYKSGNGNIELLDREELHIGPYACHTTFINTIKFYGMSFGIDFVEPIVCTSCTDDDYPCDGWIDYHHFCQ